MRKICLFFVLLTICISASAQSLSPAYLAYIDAYRDMAIEQQRNHQVPAAITMAQGLLESAAGKSDLALNANNHFGIKCGGDWVGRKTYKDDDHSNECFRVYADVMDSYEDHSLFLLRKRYESLFALAIDDYQGWAYGLKTCGYATDPKYPEKLIRIIETYDLHQLTLDAKLTVGRRATAEDSAALAWEQEIAFSETADRAHDSIPMTDIVLYHNHQSGFNNGVQYVLAGPYDTYASLAKQLNMYERRLRKYNDALDEHELQEGEIVYIYPKKNRASRRTPYCYFRDGDTAWSISQRYGIKMKSLYKHNGIPFGVVLHTHQRLDLR